MASWGKAGSLGAVLLFVAVLLLVWGLARRVDRPTADKPAPAPMSSLGRESQRLLGNELTQVHLGMSQPDLQRARPRARRHAPADEPLYQMLKESLGPDAQVLYAIHKQSLLLQKIQIARKLSGVEAIAPRIAELQSRLGAPSGVWDCRADATLPTRRFAWLGGAAGAMDSYLVIGDRVALTFYVASVSTLQSSLEQAGCAPTQPDRLSQFPALPQPTKRESSP